MNKSITREREREGGRKRGRRSASGRLHACHIFRIGWKFTFFSALWKTNIPGSEV